LGTGMDTLVNAIAADEGIVYATGTFTTAGGNSATKIAKWSDVGVGVNEISQSTNISVFPNPSSGIFSFEKNNFSENCTIEIFNSLGEKVIGDLRLANSVTEIDLNDQATGIYFYRVMLDGKIISTGKIVKQ